MEKLGKKKIRICFREVDWDLFEDVKTKIKNHNWLRKAHMAEAENGPKVIWKYVIDSIFIQPKSSL